MKNLYIVIIAFISATSFGQIQQNVNKTTGTISNPITEIDSIRFNANQTEMEIILQNGSIQNHSISTINNVTFSGQLIGSINSLDCEGVIISGSLIDGVPASGVSVEINYSGGNGLLYSGQNVSSAVVTGLTASLASGDFANGPGSLTYTITGTPNGSGTAIFALNVGGQTCSLEIIVDSGTITSIECNNANIIGSLVDGLPSNGVSIIVDYAGGNGGAYTSQNIQSTGILGLTANLSADFFAIGNGALTLSVIGTPNGSGTANFIFNIGGETCVLEVLVDAGSITSLDCVNATITGNLVEGELASTVSAAIDYVGGNGGVYAAQNIQSTGVLGLTANLSAGSFIVGNSNLNFSISGTPISSGTASFEIEVGGAICILEVSVMPIGNISSLDCSGAVVNGNVVAGVATNGVSAEIEYAGGNGGVHYGQVVNSTGVNGLTATLISGSFMNGDGLLVYTITGTPNSSGSASFLLNIGGQSCNLNITVNPGAITALNCGSASNMGTLTAGVLASGVSSSVPYSGGNGGIHNGQVVSSTGVTGLTATLAAGNFANGSGTLNYIISGTPSAPGTSSFSLNIGGKVCTLSRSVAGPVYPAGTVHCTASPITDVVNPGTGRTWMDRNLGAFVVATSSTHTSAYGDLYQWGRRADGHQCRNSSTTTTLSSSDQPGHGNFILSPNLPSDWRNPHNNNLWQGVNGVNNPCPSGYRLPTEAEFNAEIATWSNNNSTGAFNSPLKFTRAGMRLWDTGSLAQVGNAGIYWLSTTLGSNQTRAIFFSTTQVLILNEKRAAGYSVRCIKN
jgi:uncharacterized protein (TIGR02145 family)